MARGPKKHLKRLNAPKSWMLSKMGGTWAPRPSTGPHKLRESLPICLALRNKLKYALTRRETIIIVMRRSIEVDGKVRTDINYPTGFQDVIRIPKSDEQFRILYDVKGRFILHAITPEEAQYKLCRVVKKSRANKASIGRNPFQTGQAAAIPYIVTHDGRTLKYPHPDINLNDTVKFDIKTGKIAAFVKFAIDNMAMVTKGANIGRVGTIKSFEKHEGSFDIVHLRDSNDNNFATRASNVFVIGEGSKEWISLPSQKGVRLSILEERPQRISKGEKAAKKSSKAAKHLQTDQ